MKTKKAKSYVVCVYQNRDEFADMMTDGAYHDDWLDPNDDENVREFEFSTEAEAREFLAKAADEANSNSGIESYAASVYEVGPRGGRKMLF